MMMMIMIMIIIIIMIVIIIHLHVIYRQWHHGATATFDVDCSLHFCPLQCFDAIGWAARRASGL